MREVNRIPSGELQRETLQALRNLGRASAADVHKKLKARRALAYTTVNTVLDRLYRQGLVQRTEAPGRGGMKYIYSPATTASLRTTIVPGAIDSLVKAFGPSVVSVIYEGLEHVGGAESGRKRVSKPRTTKR